MEILVVYLLGVIAVMLFMKYGDNNALAGGAEAFGFWLFTFIGLLSWLSLSVFIIWISYETIKSKD